jgi:hypothetical protein
MIKLYRSSLVLGIIALTILGLNISNQGINSLVMQNRQPVLAYKVQSDKLDLIALGKSYSVKPPISQPNANRFGQKWDKYRHSAGAYLDSGSDKVNAIWFDFKKQIILLPSRI